NPVVLEQRRVIQLVPHLHDDERLSRLRELFDQGELCLWPRDRVSVKRLPGRRGVDAAKVEYVVRPLGRLQGTSCPVVTSRAVFQNRTARNADVETQLLRCPGGGVEERRPTT